jgi:hypothetical protein
MGKLVEEVKEWNTPAVGAYLLWRFTKSYMNCHRDNEPPVVILHFIVCGILSKNEIADSISGKRPNLASFVRWFHDEKRTDLLACLQQSVLRRREYTMQAIDIAVASGLLVWDADTARLYSRDISISRGSSSKGISVQTMGKKAEVLGRWFAEYDVPAIASSLEVVL